MPPRPRTKCGKWRRRAVLPYTPEVEFTVGQVVVYGGAGAGAGGGTGRRSGSSPARGVARDTGAAPPEPQEVFVLELPAALPVTLPIALAQEQLRAVMNE